MSGLQAAGAVLGAAAMADPGDPRASLYRLVQRATFGITRSELSLATMMGTDGYLKYQLHPESIDDSACDAIINTPTYNTLVFTPDQFVGQNATNVANQLIKATIVRAIFSRRQLFERMVEFWSDHFSIWLSQDGVTLLKTVDDRDVIRANALGSFGTMLRASAHSPAMMEYLNNNTNRVGAPNENYARELMELHTLGVNGGYTQTDVQQVAKCFTGWSYYGSTSGTLSYTFRYIAGNHDTSQKTVLGHVVPARSAAQGQQDGDDVLNILINHPSTAQFIGGKLLKRFWGENPPQAYIDQVAAAYTATGGDIKSMLKVVFGLVLGTTAQAKYKRPFHVLVSALRAVNANVVSPTSLQTPLVTAGHSPFNWITPDGYPDTLTYWVGGLLARWNFGASLMNSEYSQVTVDDVTLLAGATTPQQIADRINQILFCGRIAAADLQQVLSYLGAVPTAALKREAIGLAVASPSFQWY